jgi:hypothetical protein
MLSKCRVIKDDEMRHVTHGEEKGVQGCGGEDWRMETTWTRQAMMELKWILLAWEGMGWNEP